MRTLTVAIALSATAPALGATKIDLSAVPVCYDFGCSTRHIVALSEEEWSGVAGWLDPPAKTAIDERRRLRQALGWMETLVGQRTPTHRDVGLNELSPSDAPGQQDCIDESMNTTTYLRLLEADGRLRWHRVLDRAYRRAILDQHWAGQIEEKATGRRFVVDSWFKDNGYLPFVQPLKEWSKIRYFGTSFDSTF